MGHQSGLDQRRINPTKRRDIVGLIVGARGERADSLRQDALDRAVPLVQMTRGPEGLIQRAEHEREGDVECPVKSADRVGQCAGVLGDRRGDVRVGELEQERTASTKKNRRLSMDPPGQRGGAEYPFNLSWRQRRNLSELAFEVLAASLYRAASGSRPSHLRPLTHLIARSAAIAAETIGWRGESRSSGTLASSHRRNRTRCERSAKAGSRTNGSRRSCG